MIAFEDVEAGAELPELRRTVTREDVAAYAEASGDRNALHLDEDFARSVGFDGIIAHGMFTMGHMAAAVFAWAGEDAQISFIGAQFRAPVAMGDVIIAGGSVRRLDREARKATLDLWVSVDHEGKTEWPIRRGDAEVVFPGLT